jgi:hypothetical protein
VPTCAGLVKIGLPPRRASRRAPHAPPGKIGCRAGQDRPSLGSVADVPTCAGLVKIGLPPRGLADVRPTPRRARSVAGLVKIGRHSGALPGFRLAAGQRRASGRHSGSVADVRRASGRLPPGWSRSACRPAGLAAGQRRASGRHSGALPPYSIRRASGAMSARRASGRLPTCAVKIGLPPSQSDLLSLLLLKFLRFSGLPSRLLPLSSVRLNCQGKTTQHNTEEQH